MKDHLFPIVTASDATYAMPLAVALRSLAEANVAYWPIQVYVLSSGFTDCLKEKVKASLPQHSINISWLQAGLRLFQEFGTSGHISHMTFARLLVPHILRVSAERVLYLDPDVLVLQDLSRLCGAELGDKLIGAVVDGLEPFRCSDHPSVTRIPKVRRYFNAGVLLIDIEKWKSENVTSKATEYLSLYPNTPFSDQDALNVACDGNWAELDPRWNFQDHFSTRLDAIADNERPAIVHFVTKSKPWLPQSCSVNRKIYDCYRQRTMFRRDAAEIVTDFFYMHYTRFVNRIVRVKSAIRLTPRSIKVVAEN